eukprot:2722049-Prymnesium_polylepis.1
MLRRRRELLLSSGDARAGAQAAVTHQPATATGAGAAATPAGREPVAAAGAVVGGTAGVAGAAGAAGVAASDVVTVSNSAESNLMMTGMLANGALHDPLYDCLKHYTPITSAEFEAWVPRWLEAVFATAEYFISAEGALAAHLLADNERRRRASLAEAESKRHRR